MTTETPTPPGGPLPEVRVQRAEPKAGKLWLAWIGLLLVLGFIAFGVNALFSRVADENYTPDELYSKLMDGRREVRQMAATEWSRQLLAADRDEARLPTLRPNKEQAARLGRILQQSVDDPDGPDPTFLSGVATVLGFGASDSSAATDLVNYLSVAREKGITNDAELYALISIGRTGILNGPDASPDSVTSGARTIVTNYATHQRPELRKAVAYVLGSTEPLPEVGLAALRGLLSDSVEDVRWNAAVALTRHGHTDGVAPLKLVLEEALRLPAEGLTTEKLNLYREVMKVAALKRVPELRASIAEIADSHPNLKLRQAGKELQY